MATEAHNPQPYRVLARKYRPADFSQLIGQDALVRTLSNAIERGRLAQAYILTGVRGVGKTTTARIIARALNCIGADGQGGATVTPCGVCDNCTAIAGDRHVDVLEMDAASRTGVNDIREILDGVRYRPTSARYKVYIIDEVHMLSNQAFNALLKTLEEPPEHVKFIFATTEIRKVPVTVLSRCQRFDLRRVDADILVPHFEKIVAEESASVAPEALAMLARAADGSVRDGLSLLDQAIAHGDGTVTAQQVRDMLGLADRSVVFDLLDHILAGRMVETLAVVKQQYDNGADPLVILQDLLDLTHWLTRAKVTPNVDDRDYPEAERVRGKDMAGRISLSILTRTWQMLLKGIQETQMAPAPLQALEMILIRLVHASTLPSPEEAIKALKKNMPAAHAHGGGAGASAAGAMGGANATAVASSATVQTSGHDGPHMQATGTFGAAGWGIGWPQHVQALPMQAQAQMQPAPKPDLHLVADNVGFAAPPVPTPSAPPVAQPTSLDDVARLCEYHEEKLLADQVRRSMHLVAFDAGRIEFKPTEGAQKNLAQTLTKRLSEWTGQRWVVVVSGKTGEDTLYKRNYNKAESNPIVQAVLAAFPGAKIEFIKDTSESPLPVAQFTAEPDVDMDADIIEDFDAFDI